MAKVLSFFIACSIIAVCCSGTNAQCNISPPESRIDCYPRGFPSQSACEQRGCCWSPTSTCIFTVILTTCAGAEPGMGIPWCYYPGNKDDSFNIKYLILIHTSELWIQPYFRITERKPLERFFITHGSSWSLWNRYFTTQIVHRCNL